MASLAAKGNRIEKTTEIKASHRNGPPGLYDEVSVAPPQYENKKKKKKETKDEHASISENNSSG